MNFHPDSESYITKLINEIITGEYIPQTTLTRPRSLQIRAQNLILTQYYTYQQKGGNICGFYALFNVVHFIMYLKTKNEKYLDKMGSCWEFWMFKYKVLKYLISNMKIEPSGVKSLMNEGPLERYQFYYLLKNNKEIAESISSDDNYNISFTKFLYGFGRVSGMNQTDIKDFQKEIDNFLNFSWEKNKLFKKNVMIVLLGITNHWNILVVERNFSNFKRTNKYYFLDSRNYYEIFTIGDNEKKRKKFMNNCIKNSTMYSGKPPCDWWVHCLPFWIDDMNRSIEILHDIFDSKYTLIDFIMNQLINELVKSFESNTNLILDENLILDKSEEGINKIKNWIKGDYHPQIIKVEIINQIEGYNYKDKLVSLQNYNKFITWIKVIEQYVNILMKEEDKELEEIINRYVEEIQCLKDLTFN